MGKKTQQLYSDQHRFAPSQKSFQVLPGLVLDRAFSGISISHYPKISVLCYFTSN